MKKVNSFFIVNLPPKLGGQFKLESGGQFASEMVVNLDWKVVVNLTGFSSQYHWNLHSSAYKVERYAFLWKTAKVKKIGKSWLEKKYHLEIDREPFYGTFEYNNKQFTLANFHAITKKKQPETEIKYFKYLPAQYPNLNLLFMGDFNCPQSHTVFNPLKKMGYQSAFINQKTSLKQECKNEDCLASEFDNIWYKTANITILKTEAIHFYNNFETLKEARTISNHIPIAIIFSLN